MKPINGSPAKKGGKKAGGAEAGAKKAKAAAGAVKKTVSKAKTNVVKAGRKKLNKVRVFKPAYLHKSDSARVIWAFFAKRPLEGCG